MSKAKKVEIRSLQAIQERKAYLKESISYSQKQLEQTLQQSKQQLPQYALKKIGLPVGLSTATAFGLKQLANRTVSAVTPDTTVKKKWWQRILFFFLEELMERLFTSFQRSNRSN